MDDFGRTAQDSFGADCECRHVAWKVMLHTLTWMPEKMVARLAGREVREE